MIKQDSLLAEVVRVAEAAGRAIHALYVRPEAWEVRSKSDDSPLTAADLASHRLIVEELARLTPTLPVLSEESEEDPARRSWPALWVVDPLDGTREFVNRTGDFTVNIALVENGRAVLGVMHAPEHGVSYAAAAGEGSWRMAGGRAPARIRVAATAPEPRVLLSRHHQSGPEAGLLGAIRARFGDCRTVQVGSAFKMCRVAEGEADFYPRFGPTMEWDTAAGQILLEEAGGLLVDFEGRPLRYNRRDTLVNPPFLVIGEAQRCDEWLALLAASRDGTSPPG